MCDSLPSLFGTLSPLHLVRLGARSSGMLRMILIIITMWISLLFVLAAASPGGSWGGCQLPHDWRPQTEACRAELAEIIVFAKVLALHKESYSVYNFLPWQHDTDLLFSAEIELLCDQAWGSMLEVPAGSRFNVSGLGYLPCFTYSVTPNSNYYFFLR